MSPQLEVYHSHAKPIIVRFDDHVMTLDIKQFSTGSVGWYANGKCKVLVGDTYYPVQVSMTLTIIGSKNSHAQEGLPEAQEATQPVLMGPEYPYNSSAPEGPVLGQEKAPGIETATHDANGKMRRRPRKEPRTQTRR